MLEERAEPAHCLGRGTEDPKLLQSNEKVEPEFGLSALQRPGESGAQVRNLGKDDLRALLGRHIRVETGTERDRVVVPGMPRAQLRHVVELGKAFECQLPNRLQHEETT